MSDQDAPAKPARKPRKKAASKTAAGKTASTTKAARKSPAKAKPAKARPARSKSATTRTAQDDAAAPAPAPATAPADQNAPRTLIRVPMPVRWRDLDAFNHVNNSKYLSYLEEARLHWMLGVPGQGMDDHVAPVVAAAQLNYRRPIEWPAQVAVELFVDRLGNTSLSVSHRIVAADDADVLYCDGHVVLVWIDRESGAAAPLPDTVREACS